MRQVSEEIGVNFYVVNNNLVNLVEDEYLEIDDFLFFGFELSYVDKEGFVVLNDNDFFDVDLYIGDFDVMNFQLVYVGIGLNNGVV